MKCRRTRRRRDPSESPAAATRSSFPAWRAASSCGSRSPPPDASRSPSRVLYRALADDGQRPGHLVGVHDEQVVLAEQIEPAVHGLTFLVQHLDARRIETALNEPLAEELGDLATGAPAAIDVLLDDHAIEPGAQPSRLADVVVAPVARDGQHA